MTNNVGVTQVTVNKVLQIAIMCHQANKAWCDLHGDYSQKEWYASEKWQQDSMIKGVEFRIANPSSNKDAQHNAWMEHKLKEGWVYGELKDAEKKTHPCIMPYDKLPEFQQKKDAISRAIIDALK